MVKKRKQIITIGINSLVSTTQPAYSNHIQLFYRLGRSYPDIDFCLVNPPRMSIDRMRNYAAMIAMENESSHLLFIDDDVLIPTPFDFLAKLLKLKVPIAAADVFIRGYPFNHMFFKYTKDKQGLDPVPMNRKLKPIEDVDAVGFSCCLIETDLLRKMSPPFFVTGVTNTEDIYFCMEARRLFPDLKIKVDTTIQCGHILWSEILDALNVAQYKKYHEAMHGKPKKQEKDRGQAYYNLVKAATNEQKEDAA